MARRLRPRSARRVIVAGETIEVVVRESARARRARLVVRPRGRPEVVVPAGAPDAVVDRLLVEHDAWLGRAVLRARALEARDEALGLDRPGFVWLDGTALPVVCSRGDRDRARLAGGSLEVAARDLGGAAEAVGRWYRREARDRLEAAVARESARLGLSPGPISVRGQRTRWGSCSRSGALSFNWRLAIAPAAALDYVVVHELCHLRRHDHSPAFWKLVAAAMPDWKPRSRWLAEHGAAILSYDPAVAVAAPQPGGSTAFTDAPPQMVPG